MVRTGEAFLLDDDIFLTGEIKKKGLRKIFVPKPHIQCGFSYQYLRRKDIGKILFFNKEEIKSAGLDNLEVVE